MIPSKEYHDGNVAHVRTGCVGDIGSLFLTIKKYKTQLAQILSIRNLKQMEMAQKVAVSDHEVKEYFARKPIFTKDRYLLQTKIVPFKGNARKVKWIDLDWIDKDNLSERIAFVVRMKEGEISKPMKTDQGNQYIKLVKFDPRRKKTFDESWAEINQTIRNRKMAEFEEKYVANLRKNAHIKRFSLPGQG